MLTKEFISDIKDKLIAEKNRIIKKPHEPIDIDVSGDETDAIQGNLILDLDLKLSRLNNKKLFNIDEALKRIDACTYGICVDCDENISEKRLLANPYFLSCVGCVEMRESKEKQRKK